MATATQDPRAEFKSAVDELDKICNEMLREAQAIADRINALADLVEQRLPMLDEEDEAGA
jgi:hypothetical protein